MRSKKNRKCAYGALPPLLKTDPVNHEKKMRQAMIRHLGHIFAKALASAS